MKRKAFTMIELISVIVIIGILSSVAIPKFTGIKDQANKATELSTASAISTALESVHGTWSTSDSDFDWNNDGVIDPIDTDLADSGYPKDLERNEDAVGALIKSSGKSGFKEQTLGTLTDIANSIFKIYTAKASNPVSGVKYASNASKDIEGKPDRNDFWLYMVDTNNTSHECYVEGTNIKRKQVISGDFMLIDVNDSLPTKFTVDDLGLAFKINCSS